MQRLEELDSAAPAADDPEHALTALAGSNFERAYCALRPTRSPMTGAGAKGGRVVAVPAFRDELLWALRRVVAGYCEWHGKPEADRAAYMQLLYGEWQLGDSVALAAQRLWTSLKRHPPRLDVQFCNMWNDVIRRDQASLALPSALIARAINLSVVGAVTATRQNMGAAALPPVVVIGGAGGERTFSTWRGGGFGDTTAAVGSPVSPAALKAFFTPGRVYRTRQCLATSFSQKKAMEFLQDAWDGASELVLWEVALDAGGEVDPERRCKHVNLLRATHVRGEEEYLFSAFSVFTVVAFDPGASRDPTGGADPHLITIRPALDNKFQPNGQPWPDDLPLAPWC
jgi:hypothetical protein